MGRNYLKLVIYTLPVIVADQVSKYIISINISYYESIPVIDNLFYIVHVRNSGMAFGLLNRPETGIFYYFLVGFTILAILLLIFWFTKLQENEKGLLPGISLILGGAAGNLIDRLRFKEVIDFLDFHLGSYHWPSFNLADSCITIGTFWVVLYILFFSPKEDEE